MSKINILGTLHTFHGQKRGPEGYGVYQEQAQNQVGVHTPVSGATHFPDGQSQSEAGDLCTETWNGEPFAELREDGRILHELKLLEMYCMPKPNLP